MDYPGSLARVGAETDTQFFIPGVQFLACAIHYRTLLIPGAVTGVLSYVFFFLFFPLVQTTGETERNQVCIVYDVLHINSSRTE